MGRGGRQRAKEAKVARDLKYTPLPTDLQALQRELKSTEAPARSPRENESSEDDDAGYRYA